MGRLNVTGVTQRMLCYMFYQDAMDDHPDFETRFQDVFANGGYTVENKMEMRIFMEEAILLENSDQELMEVFEKASCDYVIPLGGHREVLTMMLTELKRQM